MFRIPTAPLVALCIYSPVHGMESFLVPARGDEEQQKMNLGNTALRDAAAGQRDRPASRSCSPTLLSTYTRVVDGREEAARKLLCPTSVPRPRAPQPHAARAGGAAPGETPGSQITRSDGSAARSSYLFTPAEDEDEPFDTEAPFDTPRWLPAEAGEEPQVERRPPGWNSFNSKSIRKSKLKLPSARGGTSGGAARSSARARRQAQEEGACVGKADDCPMVMLGRLSVHCIQPRCEIQ
eukprot:g2985.t1